MTTRIAIELVPRTREALELELQQIQQNFPHITAINIPDLLRFDIRSWEGCAIARQWFPQTIAHIRAIDMHPYNPLHMIDYLRAHEIGEVLVIAGDPPQNHERVIYPSTSVDIIRKFKREAPEIKVYAAIDPYRNSFRVERDYIRHKLDVGADGFFTQPFFDLRLMEMYGDQLQGQTVFWGVSPVTSEKSRFYWETRNNAIFPRSFAPTLEWNQQFARQALEFVRRSGFDIYFMPIKTDILKYLNGVLVE
ncbi:methylenetetrahydrofolate reductase [Chrysiogenes arsenatis]|uniref:methylenetetrahydrofolate reductase n=1 Tax=Chrysiogenes arsenatis TaxID=309797 RepID=UPI0004035921|nr:methylenetetrahydrofolate reductase [Chrysiogenes arsenatis]